MNGFKIRIRLSHIHSPPLRQEAGSSHHTDFGSGYGLRLSGFRSDLHLKSRPEYISLGARIVTRPARSLPHSEPGACPIIREPGACPIIPPGRLTKPVWPYQPMQGRFDLPVRSKSWPLCSLGPASFEGSRFLIKKIGHGAWALDFDVSLFLHRLSDPWSSSLIAGRRSSV